MGVFRRDVVWGILIAAGTLLLAGCDLNDDREMDLPQLLGSWVITDLVVDNVSFTAQLDAQYEVLVLTLRESAAGSNFFTIIGQTDGTEADLFVQGRFSIDSDDDEISLLPDADPIVRFGYRFVGTDQLQFDADPGDEEDLLAILKIPVQGSVDALRMNLRQ